MQAVKVLHAIELGVSERVLLTKQQASLRAHNLEAAIAHGKDHILATVRAAIQFKPGEVLGLALTKGLGDRVELLGQAKDKDKDKTVAAVAKFNADAEAAELAREQKLADSRKADAAGAEVEAWSKEYVEDTGELKAKYATLADYLEAKKAEAAGTQKTLV